MLVNTKAGKPAKGEDVNATWAHWYCQCQPKGHLVSALETAPPTHPHRFDAVGAHKTPVPHILHAMQ